VRAFPLTPSIVIRHHARMPAKKKPDQPGPGRPRIHADSDRETVQIRCSAEDKEQWANLASELGLAVGPWLRMLAMRELKRAAKT
jgi:hypothetical protein